MTREWIFESGCTAHMTYDRSYLSKYAETRLIKLEIGTESKADDVERCNETLNFTFEGKHI